MRVAKNSILILIIFIIMLAIIIPSLIFFLDTSFAEIVMIPDGNVVFDKGFSEEIYNSGVEFEEDFQKEKFQYQFLPSLDSNQAVGYLETIFDNGAEVTISSSNEVLKKSIIEYYAQNPNSDKHSIYLDDSGFTMDDYDNVLSINFLANEAGFAAGVMSSIYVASLVEDIENVDSIDMSIGVWGGLSVPGVVQILSGFEQGINWFNYYFFGTDIYGNAVDTTDENLAISPLVINPGAKIDLYGSSSEGATDYNDKPKHNDYYSGSFNVGEGEVGASNLIDRKNAKILFPVAGGQTVDALSIANKLSKDNSVQVIGVDTDTTKTYQNSPDYLDQILTSAIKDIRRSTYNALTYLYDYSDSPDANPEYGSSTFDNDYTESGWSYYSEDDYDATDEIVGASDKFLGTMENGGVGVTQVDDSESLINKAYDKLSSSTSLGLDFSTLQEFLAFSMSAQQLAKNSESSLSGVESKSNTFLDPNPENEPFYDIEDKNDPKYIHDSSNVVMVPIDEYEVGMLLPWIPDWSLYKEQ